MLDYLLVRNLITLIVFGYIAPTSPVELRHSSLPPRCLPRARVSIDSQSTTRFLSFSGAFIPIFSSLKSFYLRHVRRVYGSRFLLQLREELGEDEISEDGDARSRQETTRP